MIEQQYLRFTIIIIIFISIISGFLSYFVIRYQFYVWELFIDSKIVALMLLLFFLYKKKAIQLSNVKLLLLSWNWKRNILYFFFPLILFAIVIASGVLSKEISLNKLDNTTTLILATLFDIPAVFVFSATSILIEEIFFRGFILSTIQPLRSQLRATMLTSLLWVVYSISEIIGLEEIDALKFITITLFFFSIGTFCSILVGKYKLIWFGYSLRVGLITLSPIILTSLLSETDSFFTTKSFLFYTEGIVFSTLILFGSFILYRDIQKISAPMQEKFEIRNFP
ncbi:MAG: hypothetical protein Q8L88_03865 [Bacteroidota bacterium]|nr:hypothetical protein [Bacteroidota bacterium]